MPLIPIVGRKSLGVRALVASLYLALTLGAVTMIYPFWLMVSTSTTGNADWREFRLLPRYWTSRLDRFRKYVVDKSPMERLAYEYRREEWFGPLDVQTDHFKDLAQRPATDLETVDRDYVDFMTRIDPDLKHVYFVHLADNQYSVLSLRQEYFTWLSDEYDGDLDEVNRLYDDTARLWTELGMPRGYDCAWEPQPQGPRHADWRRFVLSRPYTRQRLMPLDFYAFRALRRTFGTVEALNKQCATSFKHMADVRWETLSRYDWGRQIQDTSGRRNIPLEYVRLTESARPAFREFVAALAPNPEVPFTAKAPAQTQPRAVWIRFVRSRQCKSEYFDPVDPQKLWQQFLQARYGGLDRLNSAHGASYPSFSAIRLPAPAVDYLHFTRHHGTIFRKFLFGNVSMVLDYVLLHGRALINTVILIVLMVGATLVVNPMAAYVLSRYRLRYAHHILLFLLATMAFPAEVVMIPNFLMIKSFPLGAIILGALALMMVFLARALLRRSFPLGWSILIGAVIAVTVGWYVPPMIARALGRQDMNVSLMNTFFALVLPGIANGYAIFLLKGFFDSLPPELYEAAMLDGASETRMFFRITLPLCKPVLAVIAQQTFMLAYGSFIFAFLTCQDPKMWTLMVFLYQFQQIYSVPLVMASLVVAAIPPLLVFMLCQRIILRGIVIPTFK